MNLKLILNNNRGKKGFYAIFTTLLVIIILIVGGLGVIYYENIILNVEKIYEKDLSKYDLIQNTKNAIFNCYGNVIETSKLDEECRISSQIKGFKIVSYTLNDCEKFEFESENFQEDYSEKYIYNAALRLEDSSQNCLGQLEIYY